MGTWRLAAYPTLSHAAWPSGASDGVPSFEPLRIRQMIRSLLPTGRAAGALLAALALLAAACSRAATGAGPAGLGVLRVATTEPAALDPVLASQPAERLVVTQLFDGLVRYDNTTAAIMPAVATSWTISRNNTVYTFHLRSGARFSNGERVTAESFVRGWTRALTPALYHSPGSLSYELEGIQGASQVSSGATALLSGVEATNPRTLVVHLSAPDAEFLIRCGDVVFDPIPSAAAMASARPSWAQSPVGDGSFKLAGPWVPGQSIVLVPNRFHDGGAPKVSQVVLSVFPDLSSAYAAWRAGQVDWTLVPPVDASFVLKAKKDVINRSTAAIDYLVIGGVTAGRGSGGSTQRATAGAEDPLALREAISLAINRGQIAAGVFAGSVTPATGIVPPLIPGSASSIVSPGPRGVGGLSARGPCSACRFDPARARQLLAQSGVTFPGVFPLYYPPGTGAEAWMAAVAGDLRANLGIDAVAMPAPAAGPNGSYAALLGGSPGGAGLGLSRMMRFPTAGDVLGSLLGTGGADNLSGYTNPAFDAVLVKAKALSSPLARAAAYGQAERLALQDLPIIPLFWPTEVALARAGRWSGLGMDAFGDPTLPGVTLKP